MSLVFLLFVAISAIASEKSLNRLIQDIPKITFYYKNSSQLLQLHSSEITPSCENLPVWTKGLVSFIGNDNCVKTYSKPDCKENSRLITQIKRGLSNFSGIEGTRSFQACDKLLNVSPYKDYRIRFYSDQEFKYPSIDLPITHDCMDLIGWARNRASSIKTDVCAIYYTEPNCVGQSRTLQAGSWFLEGEKFAKNVESFRPCDEDDVLSTKYHKMTVNLIEFSVEQIIGENGTEEQFKMGQVKEFKNVGNFTEKRAYQDGVNLTEVARMEMVVGSEQLNRFKIDPKIKFRMDKIDVEAKDVIKEALLQAYSFKRKANQLISTRFELAKETYIKSEDNVEIKPCQTCKIYSTLKFKSGFNFRYTARARISGVNILGNLLKAKEIKEVVGKYFEYFKEIDEDTVEVEFTERLSASYFMKPEIHKRCFEIEGCVCGNQDGENEKLSSNKYIYIGVGVAVALVVVVALVIILLRLKKTKMYSMTEGTQLVESGQPEAARESGFEIVRNERIINGDDFLEISTDDLEMQLELIRKDIDKLELDVECFEGPHFTKVYRTLQGDCSKLQLDLDKLNVEGREDVRKERRKLYVKIDQLADELAGKAHEDGKICEFCEIKE